MIVFQPEDQTCNRRDDHPEVIVFCKEETVFLFFLQKETVFCFLQEETVFFVFYSKRPCLCLFVTEWTE